VHEVGNGIDRRMGSLRSVHHRRARLARRHILSMRHIATAAGVPQRVDALIGDVQRRLNMIVQRERHGPSDALLSSSPPDKACSRSHCDGPGS